MAVTIKTSQNNHQSSHLSDVEQPFFTDPGTDSDSVNYSKRSQWLRAAVLGAIDGLISTTSLMMGVSAVKQDIKTMILTGFAGMLAGALSMAIGEFVSVYSQLDTELAQIKRDQEERGYESESDGEDLPNPLQAGLVSALSFSIGAVVPLLAASFIPEYNMRLRVVVVAVTLALILFGWLGAALGKAPVLRSTARILVGGWLAMAITFGLTKMVGSSRLAV